MDIQKLVEEKRSVCNERDLCAELYNVWITKLHEHQEDADKYEMYVNLIQNMEPYSNTLKARIREINKLLCEHYNVDTIEKTPYYFECTNKYGFYTPNNK
jgi:hypothetical protein